MPGRGKGCFQRGKKNSRRGICAPLLPGQDENLNGIIFIGQAWSMVCDNLVNNPTILYEPGMRRNCRSITTSPEIVKHIDGLTEAYFNLLTKLIEWLDAKQETEPKFQSVVVTQLSRIETAISLIQVAVLAQDQRLKFYDADKLNKDAKAAEEFISRQAFESGLAAVKYIYKQEPKPEARHDRRRRWWGWEI